MPEPDLFNLDKQRAVRREAGAVEQPVILGGEVIATLPAELPLDVFAPIKNLDLDLALLVRQALDLSNAADDAQAQRQATDLVVDLIVSRPSLPVDVLDAISQMGRALLGDDGYDRFVAARPSGPDVSAFAKALFRHYGVSLGEASPSPVSSTSDGTTSTPISSGSTDSTPEASTPTPEVVPLPEAAPLPGSSESAA